ncbi:hypothetical protein [Paenibacillus macquariensis]|uniref:Prenyltransferase n=1 Tax=Paenibacillus macquariensis TaxID=948756 RepID=A0ABY1JXU0_9BACL|nr:hypothetical protein [Paenibacillus macquariensis]MEC0089254.1 hypothetical protein [Paenibacillus macquariensis]OAB33336.1 hypothetical protein PMSM_15120 [Paenibacillus macquariensis subsp. macquariensis]SIQ95485.1 hypothetical protein SAMN05421578_105206 [Paenibacillus macquariensis]
MPANREIRYVIEESIRYLESYPDVAMDRCEISRRKWDGAWWHMATLYEMGEVKQIPESAIARAKYLLEAQTWPVFVISDSDHPISETDKRKMDCCHCELAVYYMILMAYGCDLDKELPWIREWFLKHQLSDGGLNCEPEAYTDSNKSSIVSTLPPLEAILLFTNRDFTVQEEVFLDEGARYLIEHRLVCSKQSGHIIDKDWLKPCFPRFFEYDILRGMSYLAEWSRRRNKPLPMGLLNEGMQQLNSFIEVDGLRIGRQVFDPQGPWGGHTFPLLEALSRKGEVSPYLTRQLEGVRAQLEYTVNESIY